MLTKYLMTTPPVKREGNLVAVYVNSALRIFDRVGDALVQYQAVTHGTTNIGSVTSCQFSHDGNYVAVATTTGLALFALLPDGNWTFRNFITNTAHNNNSINTPYAFWDFTNQYIIVSHKGAGNTSNVLPVYKVDGGNLTLVSNITISPPLGSTVSGGAQFSPCNKYIVFQNLSLKFDVATGAVDAVLNLITGDYVQTQVPAFLDSQTLFSLASPSIPTSFRSGAFTLIDNITPAQGNICHISKSGNYALSSSGLLRRVGKTFQTVNTTLTYSGVDSYIDVNDSYIYRVSSNAVTFARYNSTNNTVTTLSVPAILTSNVINNLSIYPSPFVKPVIAESQRSSTYLIYYTSAYENADQFLYRRTAAFDFSVSSGNIGSLLPSGTTPFRYYHGFSEDLNYVFGVNLSASASSPQPLYIYKRNTSIAGELRYTEIGTSQNTISTNPNNGAYPSRDGTYIAVPSGTTVFMFKRTGDSVANLTSATVSSSASAASSAVVWNATGTAFFYLGQSAINYVTRSGDSFSQRASLAQGADGALDVHPNFSYIVGNSGRLYVYNDAAGTIALTPGPAVKFTPPTGANTTNTQPNSYITNIAWNPLGTHVAISGSSVVNIYRFNSGDPNNLTFTQVASIPHPNRPLAAQVQAVRFVRFTADNNSIICFGGGGPGSNFNQTHIIEWVQANETATLTAYNNYVRGASNPAGVGGNGISITPNSVYGLVNNAFTDFNVVGSLQNPYLTFYTSNTLGMTVLAGQPNIAPTSPVRDVVFFDGGDKVLAASDTEKLTIYARTGSSFGRMENVFGENPPTHTATSVTGQNDGTAFFTNADTAPRLRMYWQSTPGAYTPVTIADQPPGVVNKVLLNNAGDILLVGSNQHPYITHYNTNVGGLTKQNDFVDPPLGEVTQLCFSGDDQYMVAGFIGSHKMNIYKRGSGSGFVLLANADLPPNGNITALCMNFDGSLLVVGTDAAPYLTVYLRNIESFTRQSGFAQTPTGTVTDVTFAATSNSQLFATSLTSPYTHQYLKSGVASFSKVIDANQLAGPEATSFSFNREF